MCSRLGTFVCCTPPAFVVDYGIFWFILVVMVYYGYVMGILWYIIVCYSIFYYIMVYHTLRSLHSKKLIREISDVSFRGPSDGEPGPGDYESLLRPAPWKIP